MQLIRPLALALACLTSAVPLTASAADTSSKVAEATAEAYIVKFAEPGLLYYTGGTGELRATAPTALGARKLDAQSPAALAYRSHLKQRLGDYLQAIDTALGHRNTPLHNYDVMYHGVALMLTAEEAAKLRGLPGITSVEPGGTFELQTDSGPTLIGAPSIWNGTSVPGGVGTRGQGVVIGVIDSGSNADHPSFANDLSCGHSAANPKLASNLDCLATNCVGGNPEDTDPSGTGHGVHTASTAGGNTLVPPLTVSGVPLKWQISGVAPCATIRTYKVCATNSCSGTAIQAAIQQAITDQVDVINFSISGGSAPWTDTDRAFLDAVNADIFVAASAGNTSTTITNPVGAVNHRGPWVMSVANSTHDRVEGNRINVAGGPQNVPSQTGTGPAFPSTVTSQVAVASALGNEQGCNPGFAAGSMTGKIALIQRGTCGFAEKVTNATTAGATGAIIYNNTGGPPIVMGALTATTIPSIMVSNLSGNAMRDFLVTNPSAQMTVNVPTERLTDPNFADVLNASSLRGPNDTFDVTKPDITGPGTNIYAAIGDIAPAGGVAQFGFLSGTSMSSPHTAGAAALIRAVNPSWTPQEVKSALQLTTKVSGLKSDGLLPWDPDDIGNGRIDLSKAARSGLVMNETFANFLAANPASGGQPRNLNLPSLRHTSCNGGCTFTRTFRNTRSTPTTWNAVVSGAPAGTQIQVSPASFSFTGNTSETQTVTISVTITAPAGITTTAFGALSFTEASAAAPDARLTVAIRGASNAVFANGFE